MDYRYKSQYKEDRHGTIDLGKKGFVMPMGRATEGGKTPVKVGTFFGIIACVVAVILLIAVYVLAKPNEELPMYNVLHKSIGQPIELVSSQLKLDESQLMQVSEGVYMIPGECKFCNISFDVFLCFEENEKLLKRFLYIAEGELETKAAAKKLAALSDALLLEQMELSNGECLELTQKSLREYFNSGKPLHEECTVNLGGIAFSVKEYIQYLESTDYWEGKNGEYLFEKACYYEDLIVEYSPETKKTAICISCGIAAERK